MREQRALTSQAEAERKELVTRLGETVRDHNAGGWVRVRGQWLLTISGNHDVDFGPGQVALRMLCSRRKPVHLLSIESLTIILLPLTEMAALRNTAEFDLRRGLSVRDREHQEAVAALETRLAEAEARRVQEAANAREAAEKAAEAALRLTREDLGVRELQLEAAHRRELEAVRAEAEALREAIAEQEETLKQEMAKVGGSKGLLGQHGARLSLNQSFPLHSSPTL